MYQSYSKENRTYAAEVITKSESLKPCKPVHKFDQENISPPALKRQESKDPENIQKANNLQNISQKPQSLKL